MKLIYILRNTMTCLELFQSIMIPNSVDLSYSGSGIEIMILIHD